MTEQTEGAEVMFTKPPQRPHHWMNADGTCHAGDLFEQGMPPAIALYTFEQMEAWVTAERAAAEVRGAQAERALRREFYENGRLDGRVEGAQAVLAAVEAEVASLRRPLNGLRQRANYVPGAEVEEWFKGLPWASDDAAYLVWDCNGETRGSASIGWVNW